MPIETNFKSFSKDLYKLKINDYSNVSRIMSYEDAHDLVINDEEITAKLKEKINQNFEDESKSKTVIKNKQYFRYQKKTYTQIITKIVVEKGIQVSDYDRKQLIKKLVDDIVGFNILSELMEDDAVTDIYCVQWNKIYYESSKYDEPQKYDKSFKSPKEYKDFIERLLRDAGKSMLDNAENKIIDFDLYEDRYNALSKATSPNDYTLTIRRHQEKHITLQNIISQNCMNQEIADMLGVLIDGESNLIIGGITGSGKTVTMGALIDYYIGRSGKRLITCEDTRELFPTNDHTLELVTSDGSTDKSKITLRDLIILALRQKPRYIAIGEVRGVEAEAAVESMETGHATMFTIHAGRPQNVIDRLVTKYITQMPTLSTDVVERIIGSAVDFILIQDDIPNVGRRVTSITEVYYDYKEKRAILRPIMEYDIPKGEFKIKNKMTAAKGKKMLRKGISYDLLSKYVDWTLE